MSQKTLVIAEKPSVALDFKKALSLKDKFEDKKGYYEGEKYIISFSVGHLLTIADPREIDPSYKSWSINVLPILPKEYPVKAIKGAETQLKILTTLLKRKDVDTIINGCDAGREGELIFRYIMEYTKDSIKGKKIKRLWLQSMTLESIKEAFANLRTDEQMHLLYDAARSRAEADWVVGINASRALTAYQSQGGGFILTPCGRVQTPTLMMVVNRELERKQFVSRPYYTINAHFNSGSDEYEGKWFNPAFKEEKEETTKNRDLKADRIWDEVKAKEIVEKCKGKTAKITETQKNSSQKPPFLYDLTTLQREANSRFGYSAKMTLSIAQSLYETHKLITYPRTSSKHLPEDYRGIATQTLKALAEDSVVSVFAKKALKNDYVSKADKKIFDNTKISDHFAIIPTPLSAGKKLVEKQAKIYFMILQRFVGAFYPPAQFLNTSRISEVEGEFFKTEGKILLEPGFKEIYQKEKDDVIIKALDPKAIYKAQELEKSDLITTPPSRYTESSLLSSMEGAGKFIEDEELKDAIKENGIGTPATRASIIEKLVEDKYMVREEGQLIPTAKALQLERLIQVMKIKQLGSPELTGEWESKLSKVEHGNLKRTIFMHEIEESVKEIINCVRNFKEESTLKPAGFKALGKEFDETLSKYISRDGELTFRKVIGGRELSKDEMVTLLEKKKIGPLEGFRSKRGFPFSATLIFGDDNKIQFKFEETIEKEDLKDKEVVGSSPLDKSPVYQLDTMYISQSAIEGKKTGIKIGRVILGKEITKENMQKMLNTGRSNLIEGFRSTKKKRLFNAYLNLNNKGAIEFSFEEKKPSKKGTTTKAKPKKAVSEKEESKKKSITTPKKALTTVKKESTVKKVTVSKKAPTKKGANSKVSKTTKVTPKKKS